tara:strand:+ start:248 stop:595 length:348 start_codon:yes stop_codon:yes gene_type:complete
MSKTLLLGISLFLVGQTLVWFQTNSQLIWGWWRDKPLETALIYALPISLFFWYGTKYIYESTNELWTVRLIGFGMSYVTFPFLTYYFLNESMFTPKTLICTGLAILIVGIQIFWK